MTGSFSVALSISAMTVPASVAVAVSILFLLLTLSVCVMLIVTIKRAHLTEVDLEPAERQTSIPKTDSGEANSNSTLQEENQA